LLIKKNEGIEIGNETFKAASDGDTKLVFTSEMLEEYDMHLATRSETLLTCRGLVLNRVVYNVT
jgi:hypothetical protein